MHAHCFYVYACMHMNICFRNVSVAKFILYACMLCTIHIWSESSIFRLFLFRKLQTENKKPNKIIDRNERLCTDTTRSVYWKWEVKIWNTFYINLGNMVSESNMITLCWLLYQQYILHSNWVIITNRMNEKGEMKRIILINTIRIRDKSR